MADPVQSSPVIETLEAVYNALVQAQDCIRGETPEDISDEEAREDTISKVRDAMRAIEAMQSRSSAAIGDMRSALAEEIKTAADDDLNGEFLFMIVDTIMQKFEVSRRNSPKTPANIKRPIQGWEVDVRLNGTTALTIGHNHLSGMENIDEFADEVETCARHLLSFIGRFGDVAQPSPTAALRKALSKTLSYCDNAIHPTEQYHDEREALHEVLRQASSLTSTDGGSK